MGGTSEGTVNAIAFNVGDGVIRVGRSPFATGDRILSNSDFSNAVAVSQP